MLPDPRQGQGQAPQFRRRGGQASLLLPVVAGAWMREGRRANLHGCLGRYHFREPPKGLSNGSAGKDPACHCRRRKRREFNP